MKSKNQQTILSAIGLVLLTMAVGCDDATTTSKPTTKPAAVVATSEPMDASVALASYPVKPPATILVDGRGVDFPAAKLAVIDRKSGGITLRLCSDDPPAAIDPGYAGNSFVLDMRLSIDRLEDIPASNWDYRSKDGDEFTSGFFINGYKEQYRPAEVHVSFQKDGNDLLTDLSGTFLYSNSQNPAAPPERVQITGSLRTPLPTN